MPYYIGLVDAGFLKAGGANSLGLPRRKVSLNATEIVSWLRGVRDYAREEGAEPFRLLRAYWYDGAFDPRDARYESQRRYFDAIARTPGVQLRLGHILQVRRPGWHYALRRALEECAVDMEEFESHFQFRPQIYQKGVDTLIVLDLVRLAQKGVFDSAILIAGDRDLAEAVRTAQDAGCRIFVAHPVGTGIATGLRQLADVVVPIEENLLRRMLDVSGETTPPRLD